jgi:transcriptional regulator with XRE-family HTH domain
MYSISPPVEAGNGPVRPVGYYAPTRPQGKRVYGWEDVNITLLAGDLGISFRHLLAVLRGQRNCTLSLLQKVAQALNIALPELITRMERSYRLNAESPAAQLTPAQRREQRRQRRNERLVFSSRE